MINERIQKGFSGGFNKTCVNKICVNNKICDRTSNIIEQRVRALCMSSQTTLHILVLRVRIFLVTLDRVIKDIYDPLRAT